jgi:hypothetical protein
MKKTISLFFVLTTLLFSISEFTGSNGKLSFKYNDKYNRITRLNGDMGTHNTDISTIQLGVYYEGNYYLLSNYIISKEFIPKTNIFKTVAELPFGTITTKYIPSMVDKYSFYILNEYDIADEKPIDFVYIFNMTETNGVIKYVKNKDYYQYNENIYIKNLKNQMTGYIIPTSNLEEIKLKKIESTTIKYRNQRLIMSSKVRVFDKEKTDIVQIRYKGEPTFFAFESSTRLLARESDYWKNWLKPLPFTLDKNTKKIVERFLIYLKTSTNGYNSYTNIGLNETFQSKDSLFATIAFIKYGYLEDAKEIIKGRLYADNDLSYLSNSKLTEKEIQDIYIFLMYIAKSKDTQFYNENSIEIRKKINRIINNIIDGEDRKNILSKGYEFKIYYYTYIILNLYREITDDKSYFLNEIKLRNDLFINFLVGDEVKKYRLDKEYTYSKWEFPIFYRGADPDTILEALHKKTIFNRYPYFSDTKIVDINRNLNILDGFYTNKLKRYGDINLLQINEDIEKNAMRIPNKIYLIGGKRYKVNGIDIYLTSKYLNLIYDRGEK